MTVPFRHQRSETTPGVPRVGGSGFTVFHWEGETIGWAQTIGHQGPQPVAPPEVLQPLDQRYPQAILTPAAIGPGTLQLALYEKYNEKVWDRIMEVLDDKHPGGHNIAPKGDVYNDLAEVFMRIANIDPAKGVECTKMVYPPTMAMGSGSGGGAYTGSANGYADTYVGCFSGETRFITEKGVMELADAEGVQGLRVLGHRGTWTDATVQNFGEQEIVELTVSRYGKQEVIRTTGNHRWFVGKNPAGMSRAKEVLTEDLQPGDKLLTRFPVNQLKGGRGHGTQPSPVGIMAGFVYGDGSICGANACASARFYGAKDAEMLKWFANHRVFDRNDDSKFVGDLPRFFKGAPPLNEHVSYLYGWLAGYFAADGTVSSSGTTSIDAASIESIDLIRDVCNRLGIATYGASEHDRVGINQTEPSTMYRVVLNALDLSEEFFLLSHHRALAAKRFEKENPKSVAQWKVESVRHTGEFETVYCAVVPKGQAFALENHILTGNCVITDIRDDEQIDIGTMSVTKSVTVQYRYSFRTHDTRLNGQLYS